MSEQQTAVLEQATKITKVKITQINRFVSRTGKNTRQAIPTLASLGYVFFPSELTPDLVAERDEPAAEGAKKPAFLGMDKEHPRGVVLWDMVYGPSADEASKKYFVKLIRENEPAVYGIANSVYRLGQRDPVEVCQDENGYKLIDGFVRLISCIIRDILAELAKLTPYGTIRAQIVAETEVDDLEDISLQKNMMRLELKKSDLARRFYEMSLLGREDEGGETPAEEEGGTKKRKKKNLSDQQIADRSGLPKEGGRQKVYQFRTVYEWCVKQGTRGQTYLDKWDAGKITLKELLERATGKVPQDGSAPKEKKDTRPRCLSYPAAYKLFNSDALSKVAETMHPEIPLNVKLDLIRYGLKVAMQQADKQTPEAPATEPPAEKKGSAKAEQTPAPAATETAPETPADGISAA